MLDVLAVIDGFVSADDPYGTTRIVEDSVLQAPPRSDLHYFDPARAITTRIVSQLPARAWRRKDIRGDYTRAKMPRIGISG